MGNVGRAINRARQGLRPKTPTNLDFTFELNHVPKKFIRKDIRWFDGKGVLQRIVIMATDTQLKKLRVAKRWEVDATFQIVPDPFYQIFAVHTSIRKGKHVKTVPLTFALMSCKTKIAYLKLLRALVSLLGPFGTLRLVAVSLDFESGLWGAFSTVFPNVSFRGCSFHFSQAVFRQIQKCGLANLYRRNERIRRICRKLMALNLLPHRFIPRLFRDLKTQVRGALTRSLFDYMEKTWLNSTVWRPKSWSVFMQPIQTNSPIESYLSRLKRLAKKPHLNLYLLIELLHTESQMVPFKSFLLATDKLAENQKKSTSHFTSTLFAYWENFNTGKYGSVETLYEDLTDLISDNYKYNFNHNI